VLDEATSALDVEGRERLFEVVAEEVRGGQVSALFVSHRMDEVMHSSHRITVLRAGETVGVVRTSEAQLDHVLMMMAGTNGEDPANRGSRPLAAMQVARGDQARPVLNLRGVVLKPGATPFDLTVREGEIFGVAALEGQGQMDLLGCVAGISRPEAGKVLAYSDDEPTDIHHSLVPAQHAREAFRQGIVYVPTDRKKEGIFPGLSVLDNMILPSLGRLSRFGVIRRGKAAKEVSAAVQSLGVKTASARLRIEALSGGNQQKVVLGRWLLTSPRVLVLNDPMRGVDPGARHDLLNLFQQLAGEGVAVFLYSTELEELLALCGQVAVVRDHSVTQILDDDRLTTDAVIAAMFGRTNELAGPQ
jgi:ribose transport system ATP-binding protein